MIEDIVKPIRERVIKGVSKIEIWNEIQELGYSEDEFERAYVIAVTSDEYGLKDVVGTTSTHVSGKGGMHYGLYVLIVIFLSILVGGGAFLYVSGYLPF